MTHPRKSILLTLLGALLWSGASAAFDPGTGTFSSGEVSPLQSCFYECKQAYLPTRLGIRGFVFEDTLLMLVNESPFEFLDAQVLLMDGNETPRAAFRTQLSPEDLDEVNICRTFERAGIVPPPAGVIEILTTATITSLPEGGAYAWIKEVLGRRLDYVILPTAPTLSHLRLTANDVLVDPIPGNPEVIVKQLHQRITGLGKTQCRITPPEVYGGPTGIQQILAKMAAAKRVFPVFEQRTEEAPVLPGGLCDVTKVLCRQMDDEYDVPCQPPDTACVAQP
jgi:hypothetical protein